MTCNRCNGEGALSNRLGAPDPERDTHTAYTGVWVEFPTPCPVCKGSGERPDRPNLLAGWSLHLNEDGYVITKRKLGPQLRTGIEEPWTNDGRHPF